MSYLEDDLTTPQETKEVRIILRDGLHMQVVTVEVLWECPTCGEPMGQLWGHNFYEDGETYHCHRWENDCGHTAHYEDLKMKTELHGFISWREIKEKRKARVNG